MVWESSRGRNRGMEDSPRAFDAGHLTPARRALDAYRNPAANELNADELRRPNALPTREVARRSCARFGSQHRRASGIVPPASFL
jgi:hypothetical protein